VASTTATHVLETARDADERARTAGASAAVQISNSASGAAAQVSETAADVAAQVSTTVSSVAKQVSETVSNTAGRIRMAASDAVERTSSRVSDVGSSVADTTSGTTDRMVDLLDRAQRNPVVLGAVGLAAGFSIARSVRATDTGERVLDYTTDMVGEGARRMASGVTHVASRAADTAGSLAASTRAMAADLGTTARQTLETAGNAVASAASRASEATSSSFEGVRDRAAGTSRSATKTASASPKGVGERARSGSRGRAGRDYVSRPTPRLSRQVQDELYELGRQYPLLLGAVGLAVGAALGGVLDPTETENRMLGEASDRLKQRARTMAGEQYEQIADSAKQIAERIFHRPEAAEAGADAHGAPPSADNAASHPVERPNERAAMEAQRQGLGPV
jgi:gas vesicle protein